MAVSLSEGVSVFVPQRGSIASDIIRKKSWGSVNASIGSFCGKDSRYCAEKNSKIQTKRSVRNN